MWEPLARMARQLFDFATTIGFKFDVVDIGGGFPGDDKSTITEVNLAAWRPFFL